MAVRIEVEPSARRWPWPAPWRCRGRRSRQGLVADEDGLGRAHGEGGAQAAGLVVGGHRDEGDLAAAGRVDELEGHLDAVGVGLVEDELAVALRGSWSRDPARPARPGRGSASRRRRCSRRGAPVGGMHGGDCRSLPGRRPNPPRLPSGLLKLLLLVNSSASSVTPRTRVVIRKALSADHDVEVAETNRRDHATRLARGAAHDGVDVVVVLGGDGTLNEAANGLAGTEHRPGARCPAARPTSSPGPSACPTTPSRPPATCSTPWPGTASARSGSATSTAATSCSTPASGFDAAIVAQVEKRSRPQALRRPRPVHLRRHRDHRSATTTASSPTSPCTTPTARWSTTAT